MEEKFPLRDDFVKSFRCKNFAIKEHWLQKRNSWYVKYVCKFFMHRSFNCNELKATVVVALRRRAREQMCGKITDY